MKRLSTIIALALVIVIGGVYAAWTYAQGTTASNEITREINMAQVNTGSSKGTISATPANNFAFLVDDVGESDFVAVLTGVGDLQLAFTPAAGSDENLATQGISMIATIEVVHIGSTAPTYTGVDKSNADITVVPLKAKTDGANVVTISGNGVDGTTKITAAEIVNALIFCEGKEVKLPDKSANDAFHNVLKNYTIKITVTEVVTTNS